MKFKLYPHQQDAVDNYHKSTAKKRLIVAVTAFGKSIVIAHITDPNEKTLVLVPNKELVEQNASKFSYPTNKWYSGSKGHYSNTVISTFASLKSRLKINKDIKFDRVIIDESNQVSTTSIVGTLLRTHEAFRGTKSFTGLTATPYRLDDNQFIGLEHVIYSCSRPALVLQGYLARRKYENVVGVLDTEGVSIVRGDYNVKELVDKVNDPSLLIAASHKDTPKSMFFCIDRQHAENVCKVLPRAAVVSSDTSRSERDSIVRAFKAGVITQLVNITCFTAGFDYPDLRNIIVLRPSKSRSLVEQIYGRADRIDDKLDQMLAEHHNFEYAGKDKILLVAKYPNDVDDIRSQISFPNVDVSDKELPGYDVVIPEVESNKTYCNIFDYTDNFATFVTEYDPNERKKSPAKECPSCGTVTDHRLHNCQHCRAQLKDSFVRESPTKTCNHCGHVQHPSATYCVSCKKLIKKITQSNSYIELRSLRIISATKDRWRILLNETAKLTLVIGHQDIAAGCLKQLFGVLPPKVLKVIQNSPRQPKIEFNKNRFKLYVSRGFDGSLQLEDIIKDEAEV